FSLGYMGYDSGSEEIYDVDGGVRNVVLQKDYAVSAGWGHNLGERLFFGAQAKSVSSSLAEEYKANTLSFDGGLAYKSLDDRFTLGLAARNFGGELKYKSEADPLPQTIAVGAGYKMDAGPAKLALGVEAVKQADAESPYGALGAEYELPGFPVALRAALRHFDKEVLFAAGLGVSLKGIALDYGFQPAGELGEAGHRFTLRLAFGPVDDAARALAYRELGLKRKALAMGYSYTGPKITVSVLQPEIGAGVTAEEGAAVADALRSGMGRSPELQLIAREQTEQILKEQHFQYSICGAADCAVEAGKLLGVRKIIGVSMMRIGSRYTLTIRSIDVETGAQDYSFTETAGSAEGLYDLAVKFADRIALGE
ncbi:MAG TPA: hypothetical protein PK523_05650, partial [Elusimicrobiales bacterium]|nr:hypothetical protein [Elusimicrobiales bacterium]